MDVLLEMKFSHSGNIVLKVGSSSKILDRDVFTSDDCEKSARVMVESADAFAPIVVWTPETTGFASGRKEKRKPSMFSMWKDALEGCIKHVANCRKQHLKDMLLCQPTETKTAMRNGCCQKRRSLNLLLESNFQTFQGESEASVTTM